MRRLLSLLEVFVRGLGIVGMVLLMVSAPGAASRADVPSGERALPHVDLANYTPDGEVSARALFTLGAGRSGEDWVARLTLGAIIAGDGWVLAPRLPLQLRLVDEAPSDVQVLRLEDWDSVSDFSRLLAFFQWGREGEDLLVRYGELNHLSLGHGSLVDRYFNNADLDHHQGGVYVRGDGGIAGAEGLLDDLFDPGLAVARVFVRPLWWVEGVPAPFKDFQLAVTGGGDFTAPTEMARADDGALVTDKGYRPVVRDHRPLPFLGFDLEVPLLRHAQVDLTSYADLNLLDLEGVGVHVGAFLTVRFDPLVTWRSRFEYRHSGPGYEPSYVGSLYEVERMDRGGAAKLAWLEDGGAGGWRHGFEVESELRIEGWMDAAVLAAWDEGKGTTDLLIRLRLPHLGPVRISCFLGRVGFQGAEELFDPTQLLVAGSVRYDALDWLFVRARVVNTWWLEHTENGTGRYGTVLNADLSLGFALDFLSD